MISLRYNQILKINLIKNNFIFFFPLELKKCKNLMYCSLKIYNKLNLKTN